VTTRRALLSLVLTGGATLHLASGAAGRFLAPRPSEAQQPGKAARVGFLRSGPLPPAWAEAFREGLRERGYSEGKNIVVEYRFTDGSLDPLPHLADELVRLKVDVIVASAGPATIAARNATTNIPVVFVGVYEPMADGLVSSLARLGGNLTGLSQGATELFGKRLELLSELVPKVARVAMLWPPPNPISEVQLKGAERAARTAGVALQPLPIRSAADFEPAFKAARGASGILQTEDPFFTLNRARLVELAAASRLPSVYGAKEYADAGGLLSYGSDLGDLYRRAATYVDQILKGTKPGDLPVQYPAKFEMVINMKTAKTLGLTIPAAVLLRADRMNEE